MCENEVVWLFLRKSMERGGSWNKDLINCFLVATVLPLDMFGKRRKALKRCMVASRTWYSRSEKRGHMDSRKLLRSSWMSAWLAEIISLRL